MSSQWAGVTTATPGLLAFTGEIGTAGPHAHAAVQVLMVTGGSVTLGDQRGHRQNVERAIIPAGVRHELLATSGAHGLLAYLDPASPAGRAATERVLASGGDVTAVTTWQAAARPEASTAALLSTHFPQENRRTASGTNAAEELPATFARVLDLIPQLISGPLLLEDLANRVGLSASRLGHLFAEHLHLPYPAWRRWARLLHAMEAVRGGATLTEAAHAAGFADSAHLTRTCRAMFGITPSQALAAAGWSANERSRQP
ncbi:AraC family transcriptional regulator [Nonomuraea africana]